MKKTLYSFLTVMTCLSLLAGCSFFANDDQTGQGNTTMENGTDDTNSTNDAKDTMDDVPVTDPLDMTTTENQDSETTTTENETTGKDNPRDNVANDKAKEFTGTGKFCGFADSNSVEVELEDGSYCTFFVFKDDVRSELSKLLDKEMASISFTYKAIEDQVNPEMTSVQAK